MSVKQYNALSRFRPGEESDSYALALEKTSQSNKTMNSGSVGSVMVDAFWKEWIIAA